MTKWKKSEICQLAMGKNIKLVYQLPEEILKFVSLSGLEIAKFFNWVRRKITLMFVDLSPFNCKMKNSSISREF